MKWKMQVRRPLYSAFFGTVLTIASGAGVLQAQDVNILGTDVDGDMAGPASDTAAKFESTDLWFVELSSAPTADGTSLATVRKEKADFKRAAAAGGIKFTERRSFDVLFNGLSVKVSAADRAKLASLPGVKAIYPVQVIQAPRPQDAAGSAADLATAINMTGANVAQSSGLTGVGIKVGIIDTGIDLDHLAFGGSGVPSASNAAPFPTARIVAGYDFVGDAYDANPANPTYNPIPSPDANPDDCNGHGTHVAGIVGANGGGLTGVAPGVSLGAYRVFGCEGSSNSDVIVAAMERALADGMQVVNQSLGAAFQWPQYPTAQAADRLVNKGVVMVASIGNSGTSGLYAAGAPGVGKKVIGVASYDNTSIRLPVLTISPDNTQIGYSSATGAPLPPTAGTFPLARTGTSTSTADGCNGATAPAPGSLTGKVVLIRRGTCGFLEKSANAQAAGAAGVILYNNVAGRISPTVAGTPAITIPVVAVSDTEGVLINNRIAAGPTTMTWTSLVDTFASPTGGLISSFSSYGMAADLTLKPNIGAPGGNIYSSYPLEKGAYATLSGTSMSAPHVAGGVALILQANPRISSNAMRSRLQNQADPKFWQGNAALGFLDQVHRQGAGMLDIMGVVGATATVEPGELSLGESELGPVTRTLTVRNGGSTEVTYTLGHVPALSTGPNTFTVGAVTGFATVGFGAPSVTVPARSTATVDVTITANAGLADRSLYGGYLTLTPAGGGQPMRVPYAGLKGDYQSFQVLTSGGSGFPWLAKTTNGTTFSNNAAGAAYTMAGFDVPYFAVHFDHHARRARLEAFNVATGASLGRISNDEYLARNSTATGFFAFAWDGTLFRGNGKNANQVSTAPNGQYHVRLSVLKALGDESNPAHWETWTSPVVTIARP